MNRTLVLLVALGLAVLGVAACAPDDPVGHLMPQPVGAAMGHPPPPDLFPREAWPLGVAP